MNPRRFPRSPDIQPRPFEDGHNPFADEAAAPAAKTESENLYGSPVQNDVQPRQSGDYEPVLPNRSVSVHVLGIVGAVLAGVSGGLAALAFLSGDWVGNILYCQPTSLASLAFSVPALYMAHSDWRAIRAGAMDPQGKRTTRNAWWLGCVGMILGLITTGAGMMALVVENL